MIKCEGKWQVNELLEKNASWQLFSIN